MKKRLTTFIASVLLSAAGHALTFDLTVIVGANSALFPNGAKAIIVASTTNSDFEGLADTVLLQYVLERNLAPGAIIGTDDRLIMRLDSVVDLTGNGENGFDTGAVLFNTASISGDWDTNDPLGIFWFPSGTSAVSDQYYFFRTDSPGSMGGTIAWVTPSADSTEAIASIDLNSSVGGDFPTAGPGGLSEFGGTIAFPEPSTALLLAGAGAALGLRRRRR